MRRAQQAWEQPLPGVIAHKVEAVAVRPQLRDEVVFREGLGGEGLGEVDEGRQRAPRQTLQPLQRVRRGVGLELEEPGMGASAGRHLVENPQSAFMGEGRGARGLRHEVPAHRVKNKHHHLLVLRGRSRVQGGRGPRDVGFAEEEPACKGPQPEGSQPRRQQWSEHRRRRPRGPCQDRRKDQHGHPRRRPSPPPPVPPPPPPRPPCRSGGPAHRGSPEARGPRPRPWPAPAPAPVLARNSIIPPAAELRENLLHLFFHFGYNRLQVRAFAAVGAAAAKGPAPVSFRMRLT